MPALLKRNNPFLNSSSSVIDLTSALLRNSSTTAMPSAAKPSAMASNLKRRVSSMVKINIIDYFCRLMTQKRKIFLHALVLLMGWITLSCGPKEPVVFKGVKNLAVDIGADGK